MTAALSPLEKAKRQLQRRPVHLTARRLMDPESGELIVGFVATYDIDRVSLRERRVRVGTQWVAKDFTCERNSKFYRLAHRLGGWLAKHVDGFEGLTQHGALKKLQELSGIGCHLEKFEIDLGPLGVHNVERTVAESLNFLDMDEGRFAELWDGGDAAQRAGGWVGWLRNEKWGHLSRALVDEVERLIEKDDEATP